MDRGDAQLYDSETDALSEVYKAQIGAGVHTSAGCQNDMD